MISINGGGLNNIYLSRLESVVKCHFRIVSLFKEGKYVRDLQWQEADITDFVCTCCGNDLWCFDLFVCEAFWLNIYFFTQADIIYK